MDYYRPAELRLMLDNAAPEMAVIIAMQAFGGLRLQEALRLDWGDVWRVSGHVEISSAKAKTRPGGWWKSIRLWPRGLNRIARIKAR